MIEYLNIYLRIQKQDFSLIMEINICKLLRVLFKKLNEIKNIKINRRYFTILLQLNLMKYISNDLLVFSIKKYIFNTYKKLLKQLFHSSLKFLILS